MLSFVSKYPVQFAVSASTAAAIAFEEVLDRTAKAIWPQLRQEPPSFLDHFRGNRAWGGAILGSMSVIGAAVYYYKKKQFILIDRPRSLESVVEDSTEDQVRPPPCQVWLGYPNKDGNIEVVGSGFRVQFGASYLITAGHNVAFDDELFLIKGANVVRIGIPHPIIAGMDIALLPVPESVWSTLSTKVASLSPVPMKGQVHVQVCGRNSLGTHGYLLASPMGVGEVTYNATTKAGYSGAPYFHGNHIFGMHTHGGRNNGGYSAMYLMAVCKLALGIYDESDYNFSWYKRLYGKSRENPSVQYLGDRVVVMNDDGHAYVLDKKKFEEFNDRMAIEAGNEAYADIDEEEDLEYESARPLNSYGPGPSRASDSLAISPALVAVQEQLQRMQELLRPTQPLLQNRPRRSRGATRRSRNTANRTSQQRPSSAPSASMRNVAPAQ